MMRCSHEELVERWALTYRDDGYEVSADVEGLPAAHAIEGTTPDIEATRPGDRILVRIIDSPEMLEDSATEDSIHRLASACGDGCSLHLVVAAECMLHLGAKLQEWNVDPAIVHVT